ncbi:ABC transporter permease [Aquimarina gracilis]|uniref:ABC transporter permease n=1 Tax=Aquimarina gracilis TaxID=874422 RepID=A0ABU5ZZ87_9FLAO|nr:ABC transporter permease [Aquimarina gracilis]MEB3347213.1 ABC transporter permease [Aquimarina gracilis]
MYTLYIKIAFRYLLKNKLYSFINIIGLAIGVASFILIMAYVNYERSYDKFEGSEDVYRVYMDALVGETFEESDAQTSNYIGPTLKQEFPEVLEHVRIYRLEKVTFKYDERIIEEINGSLADETYLDIFKYPILEGDRKNVLTEPNSIVLTESFAKKVFGNQNPMRKTLSGFYNGEEVVLTVTGLLKDIPENTHMKTNFLISFKTYGNWFGSEERTKLNWTHCNFYTYLKIDHNANRTLLKDKIAASDFEDDKEERYNIEPLEGIHLYSDKPYEAEVNGSVTRIRFLTAIAFIILILSWLNYINLSTTKSLERAKEIGVRKVAGAQKKQVILQSLIESVVLNVMAIVLAIGIAALLFPIYNSFTGKELYFNEKSIMNFLPVLGVILVGMILAGLYPAILLSSYTPTKALKGKVRASAQGLNIRKSLIILQFLATIVLLIGTMVVTKQIDFIKEQPIGAQVDQVVSFHGEFLNKVSDSLRKNRYITLEKELKKLPFVRNIAKSQTYPGDSYDNLSSFTGLKYPNGVEDSRKTFYNYWVDKNYLDVLDIKLLAGSNFVGEPSRENNTILINEACMREIEIFNPQEAINKSMHFFGQDWVISGVIENYHHFGLKKGVVPMIILHGNSSSNLLVKLDKTVASGGGYSRAISEIQEKWSQIQPQRTFDYTFLDKKFQAQYDEDTKFNDAFTIFTILAIFIAALGLFGLTSYTCIQRKKEIGIRKVNGASVFKILKLLNIDFIKWVGIAFIIAVPVAWYIMNLWLENFAVKTTMSWWIFVLAGLTALGVTLLTVSWQSYMAANGNPVDALRDE